MICRHCKKVEFEDKVYMWGGRDCKRCLACKGFTALPMPPTPLEKRGYKVRKSCTECDYRFEITTPEGKTYLCNFDGNLPEFDGLVDDVDDDDWDNIYEPCIVDVNGYCDEFKRT
jgi:hypothetical protein